KVPTSLFPTATVHVAVHVIFRVPSVVSTSATLPPPVPAKLIVRPLSANAAPGVSAARRSTAQVNCRRAMPALRCSSVIIAPRDCGLGGSPIGDRAQNGSATNGGSSIPLIPTEIGSVRSNAFDKRHWGSFPLLGQAYFAHRSGWSRTHASHMLCCLAAHLPASHHKNDRTPTNNVHSLCAVIVMGRVPAVQPALNDALCP